ncbi:MAG: hypothetical protein HYU66_07160 [Armatimonadetes bacterium]|nr:hypothetical protein [Armatimonadota bacterium]
MRGARTRLRLWSCLALLLPPAAALGQGKGQGVEVRAVSPLLDTAHGRIISLSFRVTNHTTAEQELIEALTLPDGWQTIVPSGTLTLRAGETTTRLMALQVPRSASAGRYDVTYRVRGQRDLAVADSDTVAIEVVAATKLELLTEEKPDSAVAGESYEIRLRLVSRGNVAVRVTLRAATDSGYRVTVEPAAAAVAPGQSVPLTLSVQTDAKERRPRTNYVRVTAQPLDARPEEAAGLILGVDITPRVTAEPDLYRRLPVEVSLRVNGDQDTSGAQVEVSGRGSLNNEGTQSLDFLLRAPDTQTAGSFGLRDELYLTYSAPIWQVRLGDQAYGLSRLTSYYQYGRGVGLDLGHKQRGARVGGYYLDDRRFSAQASFLRRTRDAGPANPAAADTLWSGQGTAHPLPEMNLEAEYAVGHSERGASTADDAYRVELDGRFGRHGYYRLANFHADPDYYGYYHDSDYLYASLSHPLSRTLQAHLGYNHYASNLDLRPALRSAARETLWQAGLSSQLPGGFSLSFYFDRFVRSDRLAPASFDSRENAYRLGGGWSGDRLALRLELRAGDASDRLAARRRTAWNTSLFASWRPAQDAYFTFYGGLGDNHATDGSRLLGAANNLGATVAWKPLRDLDLGFWYSKYNFAAGDRLQSDQYDLTLSYALANLHRLGFEARHTTNGLGSEQTAYLLTYTVPLGIPLAKRRDVGAVRGRIVDHEAPGAPGLARVVLRINGATALSDEHGGFVFPPVPPGSYGLIVDRRSIGLDRVVREKTPLAVEVKGGEVTRVELGVVRSATLAGRLLLRPPDPAANGNAPGRGAVVVGAPRAADRPAQPTGLANLLIEMTSASEVARRVSDPKGGFLFDGLRPGAWHLKVYEQGLPDYYYLEIPDQDLSLEAGQSAEVVLSALPKARRIEWIDEGAIRGTGHGQTRRP